MMEKIWSGTGGNGFRLRLGAVDWRDSVAHSLHFMLPMLHTIYCNVACTLCQWHGLKCQYVIDEKVPKAAKTEPCWQRLETTGS